MSTKRGGKINVQEKPTIESDIKKIYYDDANESSESKPEVFEVDVNKLSEETQEVHYGFIGEPKKEVNAEFQKDYFIGGGDFTKQAEIDSLPEELPKNEIQVKPKRRIEDLGQSELRLYQRTGIIPQ